MDSTILLGLLIPVLATITVILLALRVRLRHYWRGRRANRVGEIVWYEIVNEGQLRSSKTGRGEDNIGGIKNIINSIASNEYLLWPFHPKRGTANVVWMRGEDELLHLYVGMTEAHLASGGPMQHLATTLNAKAVRLQELPELPSGDMAIALRNRVEAQNAQNTPGAPGDFATALATSMEACRKGETAAFIMTLDFLTTSESERLEKKIVGLGDQDSGRDPGAFNVHGLEAPARLMTSDAVRASFAVVTSSPRKQEAKSILKGAMGAILTLGWSFIPSTPSALLIRNLLLGAIPAAVLTTLWTLMNAIPFGIGLALLAAQIAVVVTAILKPEIFNAPLIESAERGEIVVPSYSRYSLRYNILSKSGTTLQKQAWPSVKQVFTMFPAPLREVLSFGDSLAVNVAGNNLTKRGIPNDMVEIENGVYLGKSGTDQHIFYDIDDMAFPAYTAGAPNSGKTNLLLNMFLGFTHCSLVKTKNLSVTPFWGETKGEGAYEAWSIAQHHPKAIFIDTNNPKAYKRANYRLALEGRRLSEGATIAEVNGSVIRFVSAMQYAWGSGIQGSGRDILTAALRLASFLSADDIRYVGLDHLVDPEKPNLIDLSFFLLGADNRVDPSKRILALSRDINDDIANADPRQVQVSEAIGVIARFIDPATRGKLTERLATATGRLAELRRLPRAFTPAKNRNDIYVEQLPGHFAPIVVNMGPYFSGEYDEDGTPKFSKDVDSSDSRRILMMYIYLLWNTIESQCSGWQKAGRRLPIFFDEVADVASDSESEDVTNVIQKFMKEGRSRGAALYIGSQRPAQMPKQAAGEVLGARTKIWFQTYATEDLKVAVEQLSPGETDLDRLSYNQGDIKNLVRGTAAAEIARIGWKGDTDREREITPPFTLRVVLAEEWQKCLWNNLHDMDSAIAEYEELMFRRDQERKLALELRRSNASANNGYANDEEDDHSWV